MAWSVSISNRDYPKHRGDHEKDFYLEPNWWPIHELDKDPRSDRS